MATITGFIEWIKFCNEENGYIVISVTDQNDGEKVIMVGNLTYIAEGDMIEASDHMTRYPVYREQLQIESYETKTSQDELSTGRYLGSGAIKGVGAVLAARIVCYFKADTFRVMEEEPERLLGVKGASEKMAMAVAEQIEGKKDMRQTMMFFQNYGITINLAVKIYQEYGLALYGVIRENPYHLADGIPGVDSRMAGEIAERVGVFMDSDYRIKVGILYTLLLVTVNGHTYLPQAELFAQTSELSKVEPSVMEKHLMDTQIGREMVVKPSAQGALVYPSHYYCLELNAVRMLCDPNIKGDIPQAEIKTNPLRIQQQKSIHLDELQEKAVYEAMSSDLLVTIDGPGTGKTTIISTIIWYFEMEGVEILLAAPTGRAAKRITETTGYEARIVHRMSELVLVGMPGDDTPVIPGTPRSGRGAQSMGTHSNRNEENPLDANVIVIDEISTVDISLAYSLLRAVNMGIRFILVGDMDQLPSAGPGNILQDIIEPGSFDVVRLTHIFHQAVQSDIAVNAHRINVGEPVDLAKRSQGFLFIRRDNLDVVVSVVIILIQRKLPDYVHANAFDIQVMTPMRKGTLGVERLNQTMQNYLNSSDRTRKKKETGDTIYWMGDKAMQIRSNYQTEWKVRNKYGIPVDKGVGVFGGDIGVTQEINEFAELLTAEFDENKMIEYSFKQLGELELVYAITIHKSQEGEYPAVITPMYNGPCMLMTRNLMYAAVACTRAYVRLVGQPGAFYTMAANCVEQKRYSGLKSRIGEIYAQPDSIG